jgi:hypothetical protein
MHPDCFKRLTASLNFAPPAERLAAPSFFMSKDDDQNRNHGGRPPWHSRRPPQLDEAEWNAIKILLDERSARRKLAAAGLLRIFVNGHERARLDLNRASHARFEVGEGDELIEVRAAEGEGDLLLAAHLLRQDDSNAPPLGQTSITLEGGQQISFAIAPVRDEAPGAMIDLAYRETRLNRAAALGLRRFACALADSWGANRLAMKPALAFGLLAIFVLGLMLYWRSKELQVVKKQSPAPAVVTAPSPQPTASPEQNRRRETNAPGGPRRPATDEPPLIVQEDKSGQPRPEEMIPQIEIGPDPAPRNPKPRTEGAKLAAVNKIYVDPFGDEPIAQQFRDLLIRSLRANPRLTVTANRNEADAALKGKLSTRNGDQVSITVRLVNIKGKVIWPVNGSITGKSYQGAADIVADRVVKDLLADIQQAER